MSFLRLGLRAARAEAVKIIAGLKSFSIQNSVVGAVSVWRAIKWQAVGLTLCISN
jgi:hypothetical protein